MTPRTSLGGPLVPVLALGLGAMAAPAAPQTPPAAPTSPQASPQTAEPGGLLRVFPPAGDADAFDVQDAEEWRARLSDADLDRRERAFDRFLEVARRDGGARALLGEWAADVRDAELAWTARLLLREARRTSDFTAPRWHAFTVQDPWLGALGAGALPPEVARQLETMQRALQDLHGHALRPPAPGAPGSPGAAESARSLQLKVDPEGVRCEVVEEVDGVEQRRTYDAPSLEELLDAHPELADQLRVEWNADLDGVLERWLSGDRALRGVRFGVAPSPSTPGGGAPRTDVLGVYASSLSEEDVVRLGLQDAGGVGIAVHRVEPGTIAAILGVKRGNVLLEVNGTGVRGPDDISRALCERPEGDDVRLLVIDNWGKRRTLVWRPGATDAAASGEALRVDEGRPETDRDR